MELGSDVSIDQVSDNARMPYNPILIDAELCIRCPLCDIVCPGDIIVRGAINKVDLPDVRYPTESWYCGLCEQACPTGAITIMFPEQMLRPTVTFAELNVKDQVLGAADRAD